MPPLFMEVIWLHTQSSFSGGTKTQKLFAPSHFAKRGQLDESRLVSAVTTT